jgi:hypothetical protein
LMLLSCSIVGGFMEIGFSSAASPNGMTKLAATKRCFIILSNV